MAKRKPRRAKAAKAAAKKATRAAKSRKSAARRASAKRPSRRKTTRKAAKKSTRRVAARKAAARKTVKRAAKKKAAKKRAPAAKAAIGIAPVQPPAPAKKSAKPARPKRAPTLDRARKTIEGEPHGLPSSLDFDQPASAARSGRKELSERLKAHTSTGPAITAGDVDANWEDAESVGDEAPGGDNPTPDQDVVDDIGRALGVEYEDEEELKGGDEIASRDRHRWELDPASSDDYDERD